MKRVVRHSNPKEIICVVILIPVGTVITNYLTSGTERLILTATKLGQPAKWYESPREVAVTTMLYFPGVALNAHDPFIDRRLIVRLRIVKHTFQARFDFVMAPA